MRTLTEKDFEDILPLLNESMTELGLGTTGDLAIEHLLTETDQPLGEVYYDDDGNPVGYILYTMQAWRSTAELVAYVQSLYFKPSYRGYRAVKSMKSLEVDVYSRGAVGIVFGEPLSAPKSLTRLLGYLGYTPFEIQHLKRIN